MFRIYLRPIIYLYFLIYLLFNTTLNMPKAFDIMPFRCYIRFSVVGVEKGELYSTNAFS